MNMANKLVFSLSLLLCYAYVALASDDDCVITLFLKTGSVLKGGTVSTIRLKLYDQFGYYIDIPNLETWGGIMEPGHKYYERGNLDTFSGRGPCLDGHLCAINLTADGSGPHYGWYCDYVESSITGIHTTCSQQLFVVEQWLARDTGDPYELSAVRNYCPYNIEHARSARIKAIVPNRSRSDPSVTNPESGEPKSVSALAADA